MNNYFFIAFIVSFEAQSTNLICVITCDCPHGLSLGAIYRGWAQRPVVSTHEDVVWIPYCGEPAVYCLSINRFSR